MTNPIFLVASSIMEHITKEQLGANIVANIQCLLESRGWRPADLVRESGLPRNTIYRMCSGDGIPDVLQLRIVCDTFMVSMDAVTAKPKKSSRKRA